MAMLSTSVLSADFLPDFLRQNYPEKKDCFADLFPEFCFLRLHGFAVRFLKKLGLERLRL